MTRWLQDWNTLRWIKLDRHSRWEDMQCISTWLVPCTSLTAKVWEHIRASIGLSLFMELITFVFWTMLPSMSRVMSSLSKMQLRRRTSFKATWSWWQREVGRCLTRIKHPPVSGSPTQTITLLKTTAVAQIDMLTGTTCKLMPLDHTPTPMCAQRMKELVHLETTTRIHADVMVSEYSIIWSHESTHAKQSHLILTMLLILSGKTQQSLLISTILPVGRMAETVLSLRELETCGSTISRWLITSWQV